MWAADCIAAGFTCSTALQPIYFMLVVAQMEYIRPWCAVSAQAAPLVARLTLAPSLIGRKLTVLHPYIMLGYGMQQCLEAAGLT